MTTTYDQGVLDFAAKLRTNTLGPWRQGQPDTARQAALDNYPRSATQRQRALFALAQAGERGLNAWELSVAAGIPRVHTADTRAASLAKDGLVVRTEVKRPTDTGSLALVWRVTEAGLRAAGVTA